MEMPQIPGGDKLKSFWQRPEGTLGMWVAILGGGYAFVKALPFMISMLTDTLHFGLLLGILVAVTSPIWNSDIRRIFSFGFKSLMRMLTRIVIETDPIGILKEYVKYLHKQLENMSRKLQDLLVQMKILKKTIDENEEKANAALALAKRYSKEGDKNNFTLKAREEDRIRKSNIKLNNLYVQMDFLFRALDKYRGICKSYIQDTESIVETEETKRKAILAAYGAFTAVVKILKGSTYEKQYYDQALDYLAEDNELKVTRIDDFMKETAGIVKDFDANDDSFVENATARIKALQDKADSLLLDPAEVRDLAAQAEDPENNLLEKGVSKTIVATRPKVLVQRSNYGNLFQQ